MNITNYTIIAKEKPFRIEPPNKKIENKASSVVTDVITVLDKVSLIEVFDISEIFKLENLERFSLIRSYITTVSFIE